jgi:serine phosphatase RsbU (regulator of sigma subunit)
MTATPFVAGLETVDLRTLTGHNAAIDAAATVEAVQAEFVRANVDFLAVLEGDKLLGVCARRELVDALGSRFGFALNARQPVRAYLMAAPLRVTVGEKMTEVFKAAATRTDREFYDDVLLVDITGRYAGMIPMRTLVRLQTEFLLDNIGRLEVSRREIGEKNREMESDLHMARGVQLAMLPQTHFPLAAGGLTMRMAHRFQPAGGVSGDFFDVLRLSDHAAGILVCDVMGHGVRSALITAMIRAMLEELRPIAADPGVLLTRLNRDLTRILRQTGGMIFVTAAYAVIHLGFGKFRYAQAGHPTPLRWDQATQSVRPVRCPPDAGGPALGLMDEFEFTTIEETITAGDRVLLFTDGLFEAAAPNGEEFGPERLAATLARQAGQPLDASLTALLGQVKEFSGGTEFADDVCIVAVELNVS